MKVSVTFHEEGTPIATVVFKRSRRWLVRDRVIFNAYRREFRVREHYDPDLWIRLKMRAWRGATLV